MARKKQDTPKLYDIFMFKNKTGLERFYPVECDTEQRFEAIRQGYEFQKQKVREMDKDWYDATFVTVMTKEELENVSAKQEQ